MPPLILLFLLYRPFLTRDDLRKYGFLCAIAVIYTTPWDNYIVYQKAWQYCPTCVMGVIGYVPVEEYVFFVTQTLTACLFHSLVIRSCSELPILSLRRHKGVPWLLGALWLTLPPLAITAFVYTIPGAKTFYLGAIVSWVSPVMFFLFYISAIQTAFLSSRARATLASIVVPTVYLCWVDSIAIRAGTWHINERTSLEIFVREGLPLEEAIFFLVTNIMVVLGCSGYDLAASLVYTYDHGRDLSFAALCRALFRKRDDSVVADLAACVELLTTSSSSFYSSSFFFDEGVRRDLVVLYAFCRATDDIADDTGARTTVRKARIAELRRFCEAHFHSRAELPQPASTQAITKEIDPIRRSVLRYIAPRVPKEAIIELIEGYEWDVALDEGRQEVRDEADLIKYSNHVASSVAEMCMAVMPTKVDGSTMGYAREMGVVLQLTNIARDILTDAYNGRIYLPRSWLQDEEYDSLKSLKGRTSGGDELDLHVHALRLLDMARKMHAESTGAIDRLPQSAQMGIRIATDGYFAIGTTLRDSCERGHYPLRARLSRSQRLKLAIWHIYRPSTTDTLIAGGCLLRLALLLYGMWQDGLGAAVRYTDVDYDVFADAAAFVDQGLSPYERATYRYTPLLAWLMIPNVYYDQWGKLLFAASDIVAGWLMIKLLRRWSLPVQWSAAWLWNPMVAIISTRGNCEGLLGAMAIGIIYSLDKGAVIALSLITGLAVHFKIYPIIYVPTILLALSGGKLDFGIFNRRTVTFALTSAATFAILSIGMFAVYRTDFVQHTFLYHVSRSDHRHNFSPYHLLLYMSLSPSTTVSMKGVISLAAFLPQLILTFVVIPLAFRPRTSQAVVACFFAQTLAFVTFNKVVTSQYFLWYLVFLPLYLPQSPFLARPRLGVAALAAWVLGQALWLYHAFRFEMKGESTMTGMWLSSLVFFLVNVAILGEVIGAAARATSTVPTTTST